MSVTPPAEGKTMNEAVMSPRIAEYWIEGMPCCDTEWEKAYRRFETEDQEIRKFRKRLSRAGAPAWPKDSRIVELFCGRGNGLTALESLGFQALEGVDLSPDLLQKYRGPAQLYVGDCRELQFETASRDIAIVQGGLHHLPSLPDDLRRTLEEIRRILKPGGRVFIVEPWLTPFLHFVHGFSSLQPMRSLFGKLDAFATMTEHEYVTYFQWHARADEIRSLLRSMFKPQRMEERWGKMFFLGLNA